MTTPAHQPELVCITDESEQLFWLTEKQLRALQKGWTHTSGKDKKSIIQTIPDQKIRPRPHPPAQKPGCYLTCPFDDLCANDVEKIQAIEAEAARAATLATLDEIEHFAEAERERANTGMNRHDHGDINGDIRIYQEHQKLLGMYGAAANAFRTIIDKCQSLRQQVRAAGDEQR
jgi:hypothetical protein